VDLYFEEEEPETAVKGAKDELDRCCPAEEMGSGSITSDDWQVPDTLVRVSCDIGVEEFTERFVRRREPAMLTGCMAGWAANNWTAHSLMSWRSQDTWRTDFVLRNGDERAIQMNLNVQHLREVDLSGGWLVSDEALTGEEVLRLLDSEDAAVRVFDTVTSHPRAPQGVTSEKWDVHANWEWPQPIQEDLLRHALNGTAYNWIVLSEEGTGASLHHDPVATDAWNALIHGHKVSKVTNLTNRMHAASIRERRLLLQHWVIMPRDLDTPRWGCHERCSVLPQSFGTSPWFRHILPQLRRKKWFGQGVVEALQVVKVVIE